MTFVMNDIVLENVGKNYKVFGCGVKKELAY